MLPNWYGIPEIGSQSDPKLHYKGHVFSGNDMQDGLWENYQENLETGYTSLEWEEYVRDNAIDYLDDALFFEREEW